MLFNVLGTTKKQVGDPNNAYAAMKESWRRARAVMNGQDAAKAADAVLDTTGFTNLLIPFSPTMTLQQYTFYKAEAELPGLVGAFAKALVGGLLRKPPQFQLPKSLDTEDTRTWLNNQFGSQGQSLISFLDEALDEEMQTSRAWILIEFNPNENNEVIPFAVKLPAESVINWAKDNNQNLVKLTIRFFSMEFKEDNPHHPEYVDTVMDYQIQNGILVVQKYRKTRKDVEPPRQTGVVVEKNMDQGDYWEKWGEPVYPMVRDKPLEFIPARPLNGSIDPIQPLNQTLVNREISLYNKVSRRNHLLYGASTYTPVVSANFASDEEFLEQVVNKGLGSWLCLPEGGTATVLQTPTAAIKDINESINMDVSQMARMGIRMLTPDDSPNESGVALEIKNSAQLSQLGLLNNKASKTMEIIISMMLYIRYDIDLIKSQKETSFTLSEDFNPTPLGADWMRLVTEWYEGRKIPRTVFLDIAKKNDIIPMDYDDEEGKKEIEADSLVMDPMSAPAVDIEGALRNAGQ